MRSEAQVSAEMRDPYLPVEEVARRLDLPLGILLRRVEAGDVPSLREDGPFGSRYRVRLSDLGFDPGTTGRTGEEDIAPSAGVFEPQPIDVAGHPSPWHASPPEPAAAPAVQLREPEPALEPPAAPPAAQGNLAQLEPRRELAAMTLDPRELVAGLLDRWERTLEQRIYAEQRVRFEAELNNRQNLVKQLQLELQTARAEQAAALAERDRRLAEQQRRSQQLEGELQTAREAASRRRGLFRR
ncbi:MAG: hypothetical protein JOZ46_11375 [Candidatus Dormibacteraeota bacterium]|nr:hypothetical protein [Candidatus Dormibacteraeota bacterium]MBV9526403.1 hypothetical protein [Candidatus Dormibacteraeota bacterium]